MKCRKCSSTNLGIMQNKKNPNATDLYCKDCGAWQKFATKDEIRLYSARNKDVVINNGDRIRNMSDKELNEFLNKIVENAEICKKLKIKPQFLTMEWLKESAEEW